MIPTKSNVALFKKMKKSKPKVHQKISNTFIENAISRSNLSSLKTLYYLSAVLTDFSLPDDDKQLITIKLDRREMLKFTDLTLATIIKTTKQMQETAITFFDDDGVVEGMSLLPRYLLVPNTNFVEIDLYTRIAKMIISVKKNYTNINVKDLMLIKNKHSLRLLALLCRISNYDKNIPKIKKMDLDELNSFFGVNYVSWSEFERKIIKPIKAELDSSSRFSFTYEAHYGVLGVGRPSFKNVTIYLHQVLGGLFDSVQD